MNKTTDQKITPQNSANIHNSRSIRLLKWIREHPAYWRIICTPGDPNMSPGMFQRLIERLNMEKFYILIPVMATVHRKAEFIPQALRELMLELIIERWANGARDKLIERLRNNLN